MNNDFTYAKKGHCLEVEKYWEDKTRIVPPIQFPEKWWVRIMPPWGGALTHFRVSNNKDSKDCVCVYVDIEDKIGEVEPPYWEVYEIDGDRERCLLNETDKLLELIAKGLKQIKE